MVRALNILVTLATACFVFAACEGPTGLGGAKGKGDKDDGKKEDETELPVKTPDETGKPTDDTEGLPGYLTDPSVVTVTAKDGKTTVAAPKGSVKTDAEGGPGKVKVSIYQTTGDDFQAPREADGEEVSLPAKFLGDKKAEDDGSFTIDVEAGSNQILIVALTPQEFDDAVTVDSDEGVVYGTADVPFARVDRNLLKQDRRPNTATETSSTTDTATATGTEATCGSGVKLHGACWYLGARGESCTTTCAAHGGYDERTNTVAGFTGTLEACYEVLSAHGQDGASYGSVTDLAGLGCAANGFSKDRYRWTYSVTTADASQSAFSRACACNQ